MLPDSSDVRLIEPEGAKSFNSVAAIIHGLVCAYAGNRPYKIEMEMPLLVDREPEYFTARR